MDSPNPRGASEEQRRRRGASAVGGCHGGARARRDCGLAYAKNLWPGGIRRAAEAAPAIYEAYIT